jgi:exo-1,4-beta-D-glucosaminidase
MYWQLYDYYLLPTSAYYAAKKANAPLQLIYNYGNNKIYVVNETLAALEKARAKIVLSDMQGHEIESEEIVMNIAENKSSVVYDLPSFNGIVFLSLSLFDSNDKLLSDNFYWLQDKPDVYDWKNTEWYYTPIRTSADFKALNYLAPAEVVVDVTTKEHLLEVSLRNNSSRMAFFLNLSLKDNSGHTLYPVFWDDNYISILPGETKTVQCTVPDTLNVSGGLTLNISGWNIKEQIINVAL